MDAPRSRLIRCVATRRTHVLCIALVLGLMVGATPLTASVSTPFSKAASQAIHG